MPTLPPHPDIDIPHCSLSDFLLDKCLKKGEAVALVNNSHGGDELTFKQIYESSRRCAAFMHNHEIKKGDVVGICAGGCLEFPIAMLGIFACGATFAPCDPNSKEGEILRNFELTEPSAVFVDETVVDTMKRVKEKLPCIKTIFVIGKSNEFTNLKEMINFSGDTGFLSSIEIDPDEDVAMLPISSGTTGLPKCVMLTHKNLVWMCRIASLTIACHGESVYPVTGYVDRPMFCGGGAFNVLLTLSSGAKLVIDKEREVDQLIEAIQTYQVTHLLTVPSTLLRLANSVQHSENEVPSLKAMVFAGAVLAPDVGRRLAARFNIRIVAGYGMTESTGIAINYNTHLNMETVGYTCPTVQLKIIDINTGEICGANQDGEILVRGPQVMKGYLKNTEATAQAIDKDGWLHTGDIGHLDEENLLYFVTRLKEVIKYRAVQVSPAELESVILKHPKVADVGIVGIPHPLDGELPKAFIVKRDDSLTAEEVDCFVKEELVDCKQLRGGVEFVDAIPKSVGGKILRLELKKMARL